MNLLTIAAIGAGIYFLSQSKTSISTNKKTEPEKDAEDGGIVFIPPPGGIPKPPTKPKIPVDLGFSSEKGETFWNENTKDLVLNSVRKRAQAFIDSQNPKPPGIVGKDYIVPLCLDSELGVSNENGLNIIKETIIELWPVVVKADLPPKTKSPNWLKIVWNRVIDIYYAEICQS